MEPQKFLESLEAKRLFLEQYDAATTGIGRFLAPVYAAPNRVSRHRVHKGSRLSHLDAERSLRGRAIQQELGEQNVPFSCKPYGIDIPVETYAAGETELELNLAEGLIFQAHAMASAHEKGVIETAVKAAGAGDDLEVRTDQDLIKIIDGYVRGLMKSAKCSDIALCFGALAWDCLKCHPLVQARVPVPDFDQYPNLFAGRAEYRAAYPLVDRTPDGDEAIEFAFPESALFIFTRPRVTTIFDRSWLKTFRWHHRLAGFRANPTADGRRLLLTTDWCETVEICNFDGVKRLNLTLVSPPEEP